MTNESMIEMLENRRAMLKSNISEDKARYNDPFLGQFMRGRVAVEEKWLQEVELILDELRK